MPFVPNTDNDRKKMLEHIGVSSLDELLSSIPEKLRLSRPLDIKPLTEQELLGELKQTAAQNGAIPTCFAGGGVYDHYVPSALSNLLSRPEFMTAYTPYQPEVSQGTLQIIYEFQTHICRLTGMDVANASMYDGATALAEAIMLAAAVTKRGKVVIGETVNPLYRKVIDTHLSTHEIEAVILPFSEGQLALNQLEDLVNEDTAGIVVSQPNFFGGLEDIAAIEKIIHKVGGKLIMSVDPISQSLLKTPGEYGADIVVGEGQPLGIPISFGGPLLGFFAVRKELIRRLPGRLAARTKDIDGKDGFVLTLQTREQHIRRDKATSNICTNQALCATAASIYFSLMGKEGLRRVALSSTEKAQQLSNQLYSLDGFEPYFDVPFVREFSVRTDLPSSEVIARMLDKGILAGIDAGKWYPKHNHCLIIATTEKRTETEIARFIDGLKEMSSSGVLSRMQ